MTALPMLAVSAPGRARVTVTAAARPAVASSVVSAGGVVTSLTVAGPQGRTGERGDPGEQGPQGDPGDYGRVRYGEMMGSPTTAMPANTSMPFVVMAPRVVVDRLRAPFAGFDFLDANNILRARKAGDSYTLSARLTVVPQVYGGHFDLDLYVANNVLGTSGPVKSRTVALQVPAGMPQRVDEDMAVNPEDGWFANGAVLMMRTSVPVQLSGEVLFIRPDSAAS